MSTSVRLWSLGAICAALSLSACATTASPKTEAAALEDAAVEFLGMPPIREAAKDGRTVIRLFTVDGSYWPVVEFVVEADGKVRMSLNNVPGNFGAKQMAADVDPELWKLVTEDLATLKTAPAKGAPQIVTVEVKASDGQVLEADLECPTTSWFVLADKGGVSTPGLPSWNSCANRQGAMIPGFYGLALHTLPPCNGLAPQALDAGAIARCLRITGHRDVGVELSNWIAAERERRGVTGDDRELIEAGFGPQATFQVRGEAMQAGPAGLSEGWKRLADGNDIKIGLSTYRGLSDTEVEVSGEAYYGVRTDRSGRPLPFGQEQLWFAAFRQVWVKAGSGWVIRDFVIDKPARGGESDPIQRYIERVSLNSNGRR